MPNLNIDADPKIDDTSAKVSDGVPTCAADYPRMDRTQPKFNPEMPVGVCVKSLSPSAGNLVPLSTCSIAVGGSRRGLSYQLEYLIAWVVHSLRTTYFTLPQEAR